MQEYKDLARELIENYLAECEEFTPEFILKNLLDDTQNVFGNMDGSRTFSTAEAKKFIYKADAIFDDDIIDLYNDIDDAYMAQTISRGPEIFDVVTLELVAPGVISEMLEELSGDE